MTLALRNQPTPHTPTELAGHLTNHELQLGVPIGVVIAAALAFTGVVLTLRNSRKLAREERLWAQRSNVYKEIRSLTRFSGHGWCGDHAAVVAWL